MVIRHPFPNDRKSRLISPAIQRCMVLRAMTVIQVESRDSPLNPGRLFNTSIHTSCAASRARSRSSIMRRQIDDTIGP